MKTFSSQIYVFYDVDGSVCRAEAGMSFVSYINKVRLEQAARMLIETNWPCSAIGYDCGFASLSLFYKLFKNYFGKAPGEFRIV